MTSRPNYKLRWCLNHKESNLGTDIEAYSYLFTFLIFGTLGLSAFAFWRFLSALRSDSAQVRRDAKRRAFAALLSLLIAVLSFALLWFTYSEVDLRIGDTGRFASLVGRTIQLHPSNVTFQIPQDWLDWNAEFHNNLHLTHTQLRSVRVGHGEWDSEYGEVVNSALPFEDCAVHAGGEGWGWSGVSFGDLQVRAYVTDLHTTQVLSAISKRGFETAQKIAQRQRSDASFFTSRKDKWNQAEITYPLRYGDYGGTARISFYITDIGRYRLVMVFMGRDRSQEDAILSSVQITD